MVIVPAILRHLRHHINTRDDIFDKSLEELGTILMLLHNQEPVREGGEGGEQGKGKGGRRSREMNRVWGRAGY